MLMVHELHAMGYERLRLAPSLSPSGLYWRFAILPVTKMSCLNGAVPSEGEYQKCKAQSSYGGDEKVTGMGDSEHDSPTGLAAIFISTFPELAAEGKGWDRTYATWYQNMLRATEPDGLIYAWSDYPYHSSNDGYIRIFSGCQPSKIPLPPPGEGPPDSYWNHCHIPAKMEEMCSEMSALMRFVETTNAKYAINFKHNVKTHPIPFFGNPESAKIITVGVNPSATEFEPKREWPANLSATELESRLKLYFKSNIPAHSWFSKWERCLNILGCSYVANAAHLDLSPRATIAMGSVPDKSLFLEMVREDLSWFLRFLEYFRSAKLILFAGSVTNRFYMFKCLSDYFVTANNGHQLFGNTAPKKGHSAWTRRFTLSTPSRMIPMFFCSSSPSHNANALLLRIKENKDLLMSYLSD